MGGCVGSTVVFCIVLYNENNDNYELTTVNLGDSRSILLKKEEENEEYKLIELSADHKPDTLEEKERIIRAGGEVRFSRVDGDLALSRAIGDTKYKQNNALTAEEQKVSCVPTMTRSIAQSGDYLMLFCDGIVEYKDNNDVFEFMVNALHKMQDVEVHNAEHSICSGLRECELQYLAQNDSLSLTPKHSIELKGLEKVLFDLTEWALDSGSKDNMTCMIIKIGKRKESEMKYERIWCPGDFYPHKVKFNAVDDENMDKEKMSLDRFMRLFETDCAATGWNMGDNYDNALLQKILYLNDLISNDVQKRDILKLISMQSNKLIKIESIQDEKKKTKKRKKMDENDEEDDKEEVNVQSSAPRKRRKLSLE